MTDVTLTVAVEAAIREFLDTTGELTRYGFELVLKRNGLKIVDEQAAGEAEDKAFARGMRYVVDMAKDESIEIGEFRRNGTEASVRCFTAEEIEELVDGALEE